MISADVIQEVQLLNGTFTPSEARDLISGIINQQINFYKLQHLSQWERNHNLSADFVDHKINELKAKKQELFQTIKQAQMLGLRINFGGSLELAFAQ